jgi:cytochrome c nitrite reductase small subunit
LAPLRNLPAPLRGAATPLALSILLGVLTGLGLFTFGYARGGSYMTDDPAACRNCHVMNEHYSEWLKGSHRKAAVCNDCHTPPGVAAKYATKALNGFLHSWAFTTGRFPDTIQITERNYRVTDSACLKCHEDMTQGIRGVRGHRGEVDCVQCHKNTGHALADY